MRALALIGALLALSCRGGPVSPSPDADAAPGLVQAPDGALLAPCEAACEVLTAVGCEVMAGDCVRALSHVDSTPGTILEPNGRPLTCIDIAAARTKADVQALGICRGQ